MIQKTVLENDYPFYGYSENVQVNSTSFELIFNNNLQVCSHQSSKVHYSGFASYDLELVQSSMLSNSLDFIQHKDIINLLFAGQSFEI